MTLIFYKYLCLLFIIWFHAKMSNNCSYSMDKQIRSIHSQWEICMCIILLKGKSFNVPVFKIYVVTVFLFLLAPFCLSFISFHHLLFQPLYIKQCDCYISKNKPLQFILFHIPASQDGLEKISIMEYPVFSLWYRAKLCWVGRHLQS